MNYWVIKGNPNSYNWDNDLRPGYIENWGAHSFPEGFADDDRLFLWESGSKRRVIGFGEVVRVLSGRRRDGKRPFDVRYLTDRLQTMPGIKELRGVPLLRSAQFLQPGPFATIYPLSTAQAASLYRVVVEQNPHEHIWRDFSSPNIFAPPPDIDVGVWEGNPKMVTHLRRERAPGLAKKKKDQFRKQHGSLFCEACGSDLSTLGKLAEHALEVHHRKPLGQLIKGGKTTLLDLAVLCANCHRAIHRTDPMCSIESFKRLIKANH